MSTESEDGKVAVRPVADTGEDYAAFKIEQRGIDLIPDAEKKMKPPGSSGSGPAASSTLSSCSTAR